jgi:hypothetical protein
MPFRIIPDLSERPEHSIQSARAKGCDVFGDDPARARFGDDPVHFEPKAGSLAAEPGALSGEADILAGEPAGNDIGRGIDGFEVFGGDTFHVSYDRHAGEPGAQHTNGVGIYLAHSGDLEACSPKAKLEAADAAEQTHYLHDGHSISCPMYISQDTRHSSNDGIS